MSWTHGYSVPGMPPKGYIANPSQMDNYEQTKEEVISDVWEFSIAQAQDYAATPELKKTLQELVYSISESIMYNDKISKMYYDSKTGGTVDAE
jgi:hypothetical protein